MYRPKDIDRGLTPARLREVLHYDSKYGEFWWLVRCGNYKALDRAAAGSNLTGEQRYVYVRIDGYSYAAHRLAWLYYYGEWPKVALDHINGNRRDNRIENLREATSAQNNWNRSTPRDNTSGHKGVYWDKHMGAWRVLIHVNYKKIYVGCSHNLGEAVEMRAAAERKYYGEFSKAAA